MSSSSARYKSPSAFSNTSNVGGKLLVLQVFLATAVLIRMANLSAMALICVVPTSPTLSAVAVGSGQSPFESARGAFVRGQQAAVRVPAVRGGRRIQPPATAAACVGTEVRLSTKHRALPCGGARGLRIQHHSTAATGRRHSLGLIRARFCRD